MSHLGKCCSGRGTSAQPVAPHSRRTTSRLAAQTTPPQPIVNDATLKKNIESSISKRVADLSKDPTAALGKAQAICEKTIQMATDLRYTNVQDALRTAATACEDDDNSNASKALDNAANAILNIDPIRHITHNQFALEGFIKLSAASKVAATMEQQSGRMNTKLSPVEEGSSEASSDSEDDDIAGGGAYGDQSAAAAGANPERYTAMHRKFKSMGLARTEREPSSSSEESGKTPHGEGGNRRLLIGRDDQNIARVSAAMRSVVRQKNYRRTGTDPSPY